MAVNGMASCTWNYLWFFTMNKCTWVQLIWLGEDELQVQSQAETLHSKAPYSLCRSMFWPFVNQSGIMPGLESQPCLSFAKEFYGDLNQTQMTGAFPCEFTRKLWCNGPCSQASVEEEPELWTVLIKAVPKGVQILLVFNATWPGVYVACELWCFFYT